MFVAYLLAICVVTVREIEAVYYRYRNNFASFVYLGLLFNIHCCRLHRSITVLTVIYEKCGL